MNILSIQSHVAYGHVGNSAAVFPLQRIGVEVWPVNTVQFSNHTGYGEWRGDVFGGEAIRLHLVNGAGEQACGFDFGGHVGEFELNGLEFADRFAELLALLGVAGGGV